MTNVIAVNKKYIPSFEMGGYQKPVCLITILKRGGRGNDCAAYMGIIPDLSMRGPEAMETAVNSVCRGGNKLRESEARRIFDIPENMEYRK